MLVPSFLAEHKFRLRRVFVVLCLHSLPDIALSFSSPSVLHVLLFQMSPGIMNKVSIESGVVWPVHSTACFFPSDIHLNIMGIWDISVAIPQGVGNFIIPWMVDGMALSCFKPGCPKMMLYGEDESNHLYCAPFHCDSHNTCLCFPYWVLLPTVLVAAGVVGVPWLKSFEEYLPMNPGSRPLWFLSVDKTPGWDGATASAGAVHSVAPIAPTVLLFVGIHPWETLYVIRKRFDSPGHLWELMKDEICISSGTLGMALDSLTHLSLKLGRVSLALQTIFEISVGSLSHALSIPNLFRNFL
ncbi:hypothetical protein Tco_0585178 [Tanacetum coccineum]